VHAAALVLGLMALFAAIMSLVVGLAGWSTRREEVGLSLAVVRALRALTERTNLPELRGFVTALLQAETFGIPIANVLRIQAREMRQRRSQRAEESAQKVPVKILFPLIFCVLPALFVVVMGPAAINIFNNLVR
jgi:tight adherence protein C